jgi:multisubunit Na+/H+ antiporter MnhB subunit
MSIGALRGIVIAVCVLGIAGMIVSAIADSTGGALTSGLVSAGAVVVLIAVTAVNQKNPPGA